MTSLAAVRTPATRPVLLTDLGANAPTAISCVELRGGYLAAYDPGRISYEDAAFILADVLGDVRIEDHTTDVPQ